MAASGLRVSELFYSIQGESTASGRPCVFIRLAGCNLRCSYCDSAYSYEEEARLFSLDDLVGYALGFDTPLVEITGGEPLLQPECAELMERLIQEGREVLVETNGSLSIGPVPVEAVTIIDIKSPGSGEEDSFHVENFRIIEDRVAARPGSCEVKFVLCDENDYLRAREIYRDRLAGLNLEVLFSPVTESFLPEQLAQLILDDQLPVRMQLQLHSHIWPERSRGV